MPHHPTPQLAGSDDLSVSVILVASRQRPVLRDALHGWLRQTHAPHQIIVIHHDIREHAADQDAVELLNAYAKHHHGRVLVTHQPRRLTFGHALQLGLAQATGRFLCMGPMHELPDTAKLQRELATFLRSSNPHQLIYSNHRTVDASGQRGERWAVKTKPPHGSVRSAVLARAFPYRQLPKSVLMPRLTLHQVGGLDARLDDTALWDVLIRMTEKTLFQFCTRTNVYVAEHHASLPAPRSEALADLRRFMKKHQRRLDRLRLKPKALAMNYLHGTLDELQRGASTDVDSPEKTSAKSTPLRDAASLLNNNITRPESPLSIPHAA